MSGFRQEFQWIQKVEEWSNREKETLAQINALAQSKQLTKDHAQYLSNMFQDGARMLQHGFLAMLRFDSLRADYIASDPATIAANETASDNFFPSETKDFFSS